MATKPDKESEYCMFFLLGVIGASLLSWQFATYAPIGIYFGAVSIAGLIATYLDV